MSDDTKQVSERDAVLREREAFRVGVDAVAAALRIRGYSLVDLLSGLWRGTSILARERYPLPKVVRPRVVLDPRDSRVEWSYRDGLLKYRWNPDTRWEDPYHCTRGTILIPTAERVALWADLLARPTEEVEA